jgi:hypothetical protein
VLSVCGHGVLTSTTASSATNGSIQEGVKFQGAGIDHAGPTLPPDATFPTGVGILVSRPSSRINLLRACGIRNWAQASIHSVGDQYHLMFGISEFTNFFTHWP